MVDSIILVIPSNKQRNYWNINQLNKWMETEKMSHLSFARKISPKYMIKLFDVVSIRLIPFRLIFSLNKRTNNNDLLCHLSFALSKFLYYLIQNSWYVHIMNCSIHDCTYHEFNSWYHEMNLWYHELNSWYVHIINSAIQHISRIRICDMYISQIQFMIS